MRSSGVGCLAYAPLSLVHACVHSANAIECEKKKAAANKVKKKKPCAFCPFRLSDTDTDFDAPNVCANAFQLQYDRNDECNDVDFSFCLPVFDDFVG